MVYAPSRWYTKQGNYSIYSSLFKLWLAKSIYAPHSVFAQLCKRKSIQMRLHEDEVFLGTMPITCCSAKNVQRAFIATIASIFVWLWCKSLAINCFIEQLVFSNIYFYTYEICILFFNWAKIYKRYLLLFYLH